MTKLIGFLKKQPLIIVIIAETIAVSSINLLDPDGTLAQAFLRYVLVLAMCALLSLISGEKTFAKCEKTTGYVLKKLMGFIGFGGFLAVAGIGNNLSQHTEMVAGWPIELLLLMIFCLGVGLFEELAFRAIICDGFIYQFRDKKWVFVVSAVLGSLFFGCAHVLGEDLSTPSFIAQAALKTLSTGLGGMCLVFLYWKTRNVWACGIAHGIYDVLTEVSSYIFVSTVDTGGEGYVRTGAMGDVAIGFYIFQSIVMLIVLIVLWKKVVKTIDFEEMRKNW